MLSSVMDRTKGFSDVLHRCLISSPFLFFFVFFLAYHRLFCFVLWYRTTRWKWSSRGACAGLEREK